MTNRYKNNIAESANKHMYIGMINESSLEIEGGPLIVKKQTEFILPPMTMRNI